jgi:hypothetical protein
MSLALTWPCRLCFLRVLLCSSHCYKLSPFQAHWGRWHCTGFLGPACLFTVLVGSGSSPLSCGVFLPPPLFTSFPAPDCWVCGAAPAGRHFCLQLTCEVGLPSSPLEVFLPPPLSQAFPLLVAGCMPPLLPSPARPGLFIYSSVRDSPPLLFSTQGAPPSLLCVFMVLIAYYSVSLFLPGWGLFCPGDYADLAQGCLWEYHVPLSSPCGLHLPKPSGHGHLAAAQGLSWFLHSTWSMLLCLSISSFWMKQAILNVTIGLTPKEKLNWEHYLSKLSSDDHYYVGSFLLWHIFFLLGLDLGRRKRELLIMGAAVHIVWSEDTSSGSQTSTGFPGVSSPMC